MQDCIFCKIIRGELPAEVVAENEQTLVIKDINPKAPIHYLILPKEHYKDLNDAKECKVACSLMRMAREIAQNDPAVDQFRVVINNGHDAGQRVFHLHMHLLSGAVLPEF